MIDDAAERERDARRYELDSLHNAIAAVWSALGITAYTGLSVDQEVAKVVARAERAEAEAARMRKALVDISVYGCGMLDQPAAMNGPKETWLRCRIAEYERVAAEALAGPPEPKGGDAAVPGPDHGPGPDATMPQQSERAAGAVPEGSGLDGARSKGDAPIQSVLTMRFGAATAAAPPASERVKELEEALRCAMIALKPAADCAYNDNHEFTVHSRSLTYDEVVAAYYAYRCAAALLPKEPANG